jgi:hypothetical protein
MKNQISLTRNARTLAAALVLTGSVMFLPQHWRAAGNVR